MAEISANSSNAEQYICNSTAVSR